MDAMTPHIYKPTYKITRWSSLLFYAFLVFVFTQVYGEFNGLQMYAFLPALALGMFIAMPFLIILMELKDSPRRIVFGERSVRLERILFPTLDVDYGDVSYEKGIRLKMGSLSLFLVRFKNRAELLAIADDLASRKLIATAVDKKGKSSSTQTLLIVAAAILLIVMIFFVPISYDLVLFLIVILAVEVYQAAVIIRAFFDRHAVLGSGGE